MYPSKFLNIVYAPCSAEYFYRGFILAAFVAYKMNNESSVKNPGHDLLAIGLKPFFDRRFFHGVILSRDDEVSALL